MTKLIIVRHGETDYNVNGLVQGQNQSVLTKNGLRQARALAKRLKDEKIDLIFTSELVRCVDTAKEINRYHKLKIRKFKELNEKSFGAAEGLKGVDLRKKYPKIDPFEDYFFKFHGGENWVEVHRRLERVIKKILRGNEGKTILIVAHKGINRMLITMLLKKPLEKHYLLKQKPACVNVIEIKDGKAKLKMLSNVDHLTKHKIKIVKETRGVV